MASTELLERFLELRPFFRSYRHANAFLQSRGLGVKLGVFRRPRSTKELDELRVRHTVETFDVHHEGFALRLLHFLREPLQGLNAFLPGRQDVQSAARRDRPDTP